VFLPVYLPFNAPPSLTQSVLVAPLAALAAELPSLDIDVASDFKIVSLDRRETDIALRFGDPNSGLERCLPTGHIARNTQVRSGARCSRALHIGERAQCPFVDRFAPRLKAVHRRIEALPNLIVDHPRFVLP
jgi:DNA-binding transcriptional LysR family regulator